MKGMDISSVYIIEYLANYKYNPTQSLRNFRSEITDIFEIYDTAERIHHGEFQSFDDDIDENERKSDVSSTKRDDGTLYYITPSMQLYYITKAIKAGTDKYNNDLSHATRMKLDLRETMNLLYEAESRVNMTKLTQTQQHPKQFQADANNNYKNSTKHYTTENTSNTYNNTTEVAMKSTIKQNNFKTQFKNNHKTNNDPFYNKPCIYPHCKSHSRENHSSHQCFTRKSDESAIKLKNETNINHENQIK